MTVRIITADVLEGLKQLPDESAHCCVTSPPYFGLRSYLPKDHPAKHLEIGSEPTLAEHIARLVGVFREVRRVLRKDGTLWLNYGDMWAGSWGAQSRGAAPSNKSTLRGNGHVGGGPKIKSLSAVQIAAAPHLDGNTGSRVRFDGLKPKDMCMAPHRLAIALQDDGWYVRAGIVWHKPNPMPSSVTDRPTPAHEFVFLLSRSARYFYDGAAIAETRTGIEDANTFRGGSYVNGVPGPRKVAGNVTRRATSFDERARPPGTAPQTGMTRQWRLGKNETTADRRKDGFNARWDDDEAGGDVPLTRNARDVWVIATEPFPDAHYATFPTELAARCVKAGTSEHGCCVKCGAPSARQTETSYDNPGNRTTNGARSLDRRHETAGFPVRLEKRVATTGWVPSCSCNAGTVPAIVLDPFGGSGTVGMVADRLGRDAILIDLDPANKEMAERRIAKDRLERGIQSMEEVARAKLPPTPLEALMQGEERR